MIIIKKLYVQKKKLAAVTVGFLCKAYTII